MLGDRIIIPLVLRPAILHLLHAAHQGVGRMKARAADSVFWPNMTGDITWLRAGCNSCHRIPKSNQNQPPTPPEEPECPFQLLAADYFHYKGHYYAVITATLTGQCSDLKTVTSKGMPRVSSST